MDNTIGQNQQDVIDRKVRGHLALDPAQDVLTDRLEASGTIKPHALETVTIFTNKLIEALDVDLVGFDRLSVTFDREAFFIELLALIISANSTESVCGEPLLVGIPLQDLADLSHSLLVIILFALTALVNIGDMMKTIFVFRVLVAGRVVDCNAHIDVPAAGKVLLETFLLLDLNLHKVDFGAIIITLLIIQWEAFVLTLNLL